MSDVDKEKIIRTLFAAYLTDNRKAVEDVFAADFRFTSPYDDRIDKRTYFERCWRSSNWIERHDLERIVVQEDDAFVTYKCVAKGGKSFRNTNSSSSKMTRSNASMSILVRRTRTEPLSNNPPRRLLGATFAGKSSAGPRPKYFQGYVGATDI
jgi:Domain of unknown function (DUF4440)